jgi:hypothetical protein
MWAIVKQPVLGEKCGPLTKMRSFPPTFGRSKKKNGGPGSHLLIGQLRAAMAFRVGSRQPLRRPPRETGADVFLPAGLLLIHEKKALCR